MTRLIVLFSVLGAFIGGPTANAQSRIYIQNDTDHDLIVSDVSTSGGRLSKKAWKKESAEIASGERKSVLTINRTGKFNWMDPTPRFIEPGKTIIFTTRIVPADDSDATPIQLRQKLLGTGESSDMWHSIDGATEKHEWYNDDAGYQAIWNPNEESSFTLLYRTVMEQDDTHVEYVVVDSQ